MNSLMRRLGWKTLSRVSQWDCKCPLGWVNITQLCLKGKSCDTQGSFYCCYRGFDRHLLVGGDGPCARGLHVCSLRCRSRDTSSRYLGSLLSTPRVLQRKGVSPGRLRPGLHSGCRPAIHARGRPENRGPFAGRILCPRDRISPLSLRLVLPRRQGVDLSRRGFGTT